ncbi:MAG: hypothetical protein ACI4RD_08960 [Kiritimatiellia bacterium]
MKRTVTMAALGGGLAAALNAFPMGSCIISGAAEDICYPAASPATGLVTGGFVTAPSSAQALEARYRSADCSAGVALLTDKGHFGAILIVR